MHKPRPLIVLLAFALLIQNTCPLGFAGKSSVAGSCFHCPQKQRVFASPDCRENLASGSFAVHFPMFVFAVPKMIHAFRPSPVKSVRTFLPDRYTDALPDELLRPPRA